LFYYFMFSRLEYKLVKKDLDLNIAPSQNQEDTLVLTQLFKNKQ